MIPWAQREGETDKYYSQFLEFVNLGNGRSLKQFIEINDGKENYSKQHLYDLSCKYDWHNRAFAYDLDAAETVSDQTRLLEDQQRKLSADIAVSWMKRVKRVVESEEKDLPSIKYDLAIIRDIGGKKADPMQHVLTAQKQTTAERHELLFGKDKAMRPALSSAIDSLVKDVSNGD